MRGVFRVLGRGVDMSMGANCTKIYASNRKYLRVQSFLSLVILLHPRPPKVPDSHLERVILRWHLVLVERPDEGDLL